MAKKKSKFSSLVIAVLVVVLLAVVAFFGYKYITDEIDGNRRQESGSVVNIRSEERRVGKECT